MKCKANGVNLYYETGGQGSPLVLLHGNGETHKIFDKARRLLENHFTVYALDSRGHGQSDSVSDYRYQDIAEDIKQFIEVKELDRPVLYGFSDGGIVALLLASNYPQLLSQIIISGANTEVDGLRSGWLRIFRIVNAVMKDPKIDMMLRPPGITADMLRQITIPTTVLAGSRDLVKLEHTEYIARNIPGSDLHILRGEGHGSYVVSSTKIAELILQATHR